MQRKRSKKGSRQPWSRDRVWELARRPTGWASPASRPAMRAFADWLEFARKLSPRTVRHRLESARLFLDDVTRNQTLEGALQSLSAARIEEFVVRSTSGRGSQAQRTIRAGLRAFLRFAELEGWVSSSLRAAVPGFRSYKLAHVPRGMNEDEIRQLLASPPLDTLAGCRDRAILWILATYGVRSGQVRSLCLEDLDWTARLIRFRAHKGGKEVVHRITDEVGYALARYVREFRPRVATAEVFLRALGPPESLSSSALYSIVRQRAISAGLTTVPCGPHRLRHAFATRLLAAGRPLKTIADLLGHRNIESTLVYAKVDIRSLAGVAAEWPEVLK